MLKTFKSKALRELWQTGKSRKIAADLRSNIAIILSVLDVAESKNDLNLPGFNFHSLRRFKPTRYSIHVNGPWCVTFEFADGEARKVNLEQYH